MSVILTRELAKQAVDVVRPAIEALLGSELAGGRKNLHLVILNPTDGTVLHEESWGDETTWAHPYDEIARAKARQCYRTGVAGRKLQTSTPWLYEPGDTRYAGGVVEDGQVVAASGLKEYFDEMVSWMVFNAIFGLCVHAVDQISDDAPTFFEKPAA